MTPRPEQGLFEGEGRRSEMMHAGGVTSLVSSAARSARRVTGEGAEWVEKNPGAALLCAGAVVATWWLARRRRACAPGWGSYAVGGFWTDLDRITGAQSNPPWVPSGADLDVKIAQIYLNRVTGSRLRVDGVLGTHTANALRSFQEHNGLPPSGALDDETANALEYFFFATSPKPRFKEAAALSPASVARLEGRPGPYYPAQASPHQAMSLPGGLGEAVQYYEALARTPSYFPERTGIQSTQMSDPQDHYDIPGHFVDWGPGPWGGWG